MKTGHYRDSCRGRLRPGPNTQMYPSEEYIVRSAKNALARPFVPSGAGTTPCSRSRGTIARGCQFVADTSPGNRSLPLDAEALLAIDSYWRAANYCSVGQIYLLDNPLLTEPLRPEHTKPRLLGHFGTTPG